MADQDRDNLARQQAELIARLTTSAAISDQFDPARIQLTADMLHDKRRSTLRKVANDLCHALGESFPSLFYQYAKSNPLPVEGPRADAIAFAKILRSSENPTIRRAAKTWLRSQQPSLIRRVMKILRFA